MYELVIICGLLGLMMGSFLNAWVWRTKEGERSVAQGRSICPSCEHVLGFSDLVPVFSWLALGGKCRYCRSRISLQYPVVEIVTSLSFALSALWWPFNLVGMIDLVLFVIWLFITALFVALAVYDLKWYLLPSVFMSKLLGLTILWLILYSLYGAGLEEWLISPVLGAGLAFGFFYLIHILGRGKWMGGGDVKLVFVLGLLVGLQGTIVGLFVSFVTGALFGLALIAANIKSREDMVPFGPFLLAGFWLAFFFAEELYSWYMGFVVGV